MNELLLMFPDVELIGNEYMADMAEFLKSMYPKQKITNNNFLKMDIPDNTNAIVCNPPFSFGNDKKFYYDFLFKILADMNNKKNDYMKPIIFICPELVLDKRNNDDHIYGMMGQKPPERDDFTFYLYDILQDKRLSIKKLISLCKIYLDITITPKQAKLIKENDDEDDKVVDVNNALEFVQGKLLMKCYGFGGTNITANVYEFILYKNYRKGYGEEKEELSSSSDEEPEEKKEPIKSMAMKERKKGRIVKMSLDATDKSEKKRKLKLNERSKEKEPEDIIGKKIKEMLSFLTKEDITINMRLLDDTDYNKLLTRAKEGKVRALKRMEKLKKDNLREEQSLREGITSKENGAEELIKKSHSRVQKIIDIIKENEKKRKNKIKLKENNNIVSNNNNKKNMVKKIKKKNE